MFRNMISECTVSDQCMISFVISAWSATLCPTLCDPRDSNPPGSPVPGILQARTLEWVAIKRRMQWHFGPPPPYTGTTEKVLDMCSFTFVSRGTSSASQDCRYKEPQIGQHETADIHCLSVLHIRNLKSRCGQHRAPAETCRGESLLASP